MSIKQPLDLTYLSSFFLEPRNATHRQYEALRAFFIDNVPSSEVARRFGYTPGSFRVLCAQFRKNPDRQFFITPQKGPQNAPKMERLQEEVVALRKQNLSIYDISDILKNEGKTLTRQLCPKFLKLKVLQSCRGVKMKSVPRNQGPQRPI